MITTLSGYAAIWCRYYPRYSCASKWLPTREHYGFHAMAGTQGEECQLTASSSGVIYYLLALWAWPVMKICSILIYALPPLEGHARVFLNAIKWGLTPHTGPSTCSINGPLEFFLRQWPVLYGFSIICLVPDGFQPPCRAFDRINDCHLAKQWATAILKLYIEVHAVGCTANRPIP